MKKVLLVSVNQEKNPYPVLPLGLLYVARALRAARFAVSVLDLCFSVDPSHDIVKALKKEKPDFIGVSLRNVDNLTFPRSVSYLPAVKKIIQTIKDTTSVPLILGGSAFSLFPREILSFLDCDWGIAGEGEIVFIELLNHLVRGNQQFETIGSLIWKKENRVFRNQICAAQASLDYVLDYSSVDCRKYMRCAGMVNVQTKRGCKFKCAYCTYPRIEGTNYRLRSPDIVAQEIAILKKKQGASHVFFVDDIFTYPVSHAAAVCEALIKKNVTIAWSCFASPRGISKKLLMLMKKAGCTHIEFGSDALSEGVLKKLRKPFTVADIINASRLCHETGIQCAHYVIFGGPGENAASLKESFKTMARLAGAAVIAMVGLRIYPGTELETISKQENIITGETDLLSPCFYVSGEIATQDLIQAVGQCAQNNSCCIVPGLEIRSSEKMHEVLRKHYPHGPLWGYLR